MCYYRRKTAKISVGEKQNASMGAIKDQTVNLDLNFKKLTAGENKKN